MKPCVTCGNVLPLDDFHRHSRRPDGHSSTCKKCAIARTAKWQQENRDRRIASIKADFAKDPEKYRKRAREAQARRRIKTASLRRNEFAADPCVYCGAEADTADHIRPVNRGGADHASNLAPSCLRCNQEKGDHDLLGFLLQRVGAA